MKQNTLYVATGNAGKLKDFATAAASVDAGWLIAPLPGLQEIPAPPEDGLTFEENARAKALYYAERAPEGAIVVADDSGLEVDALDGRPGVYSARFAEQSGFAGADGASTDARNNDCLLHAVQQATVRTGRYRCVLAAARGSEILAVAAGALDGELLDAPRGAGGFGYDPLFLVPETGLTMAEISPDVRLVLSHRGKALRALLPLLAARV